ncbi:unnamed protein product [Hermetia illucens]|uniref:Uncharacterized protein n=1 Tax=Hermetia illucens TaxID=343691 RepID=A0A7R8UAN6_HERIL|nr:unnamed protein product [Hermetia illucens]
MDFIAVIPQPPTSKEDDEYADLIIQAHKQIEQINSRMRKIYTEALISLQNLQEETDAVLRENQILYDQYIAERALESIASRSMKTMEMQSHLTTICRAAEEATGEIAALKICVPYMKVAPTTALLQRYRFAKMLLLRQKLMNWKPPKSSVLSQANKELTGLKGNRTDYLKDTCNDGI